MDAPTWPPPPDAPYPRIVAANGPKMLALSADIADGALPAMRPPEFTGQARRVLGPDKLLVVAVSFDADSSKATVRQAVREHLAAGADHVTLLGPIGIEFATGVGKLEELASSFAG
ncbi:LLM class flavin-dependent oxidoreductase [Mycobacterium palustre]|uniref:Luciferase-like domain-containing protein n=1 Tax=Mycobacterium palustre TaxID=153971 RepID=A0A1X1ZZM6_9MYCO|nr:LLM class flavin-dependent oxidoreductase [Mycobacterium palustre]ORW33019.1 hypothetical protein AWC19_25220 [Mycobacterium palustre]